MNADQENELGMMRTVANEIGEEQYAALLLEVPALATGRTALLANIATIEQKAVAQLHPSEGVTADKKKARANLAAATVVVAAGVRKWARANNNGDVLTQATISKSDIIYARDSDAKTIGTTILNLATGKDLTAFNVDDAKRTALSTALGAFGGLLEKPRGVRVDTKNATAELEGAFVAAKNTLADLDDTAETVQLTHPGFYREYKNARNIIDRPGGSGPGPQPPAPTPPPA